MNSPRKLFSLVLIVFVSFGLAAFLSTGCGGSNNPSGPSVGSVSSGTTTGTSATNDLVYAIVKGKTVTEANTPLGGVEVGLYSTSNTTTALQTSTTTTMGGYVFQNVGTGSYIVKVNKSESYLESSKLVLVTKAETVDSGDLKVFVTAEVDPSIPTIDIKGRVVDVTTGNPLSYAQLTMDSGQMTTTDAFGNFSLGNIASGTRRMVVNQPGIASYTISFKVVGTTGANATSVLLNNKSYTINSGTRMVDFVAYNQPFSTSPNLHKSGVLIGTVKKFKLTTAGNPTSELEPYDSYEFDLWMRIGDIIRRAGTIVSNADGSWRADSLPPYEDNSALWYAVPANTSVSIQQGNAGNVVVFSNPSAVWLGREPVLASEYKISAGQTTVMNFTVPSFVYAPVYTSVNAVADAQMSVNGGAYSEDATTLMTDNVTLRWTGPGTSTQMVVEYTKLFSGSESPKVSKTYTISDTSATTVHTETFKPSTIGLNYGRYTWNTSVNDPLDAGTKAISNSNLFTVRPSKTEIVPADGTDIKVYNATYTVDFVAPTDPEATQAVMQLYTPAGELLGKANAGDLSSTAVFSVTFPPGNPVVADGYTWKVVYFYSDGPPMESETAMINFK